MKTEWMRWKKVFLLQLFCLAVSPSLVVLTAFPDGGNTNAVAGSQKRE